VANEIGLEPTAATAAYENLWKARMRNDDRAETYALCIIGKLYDGAEKYEEALSYYDQSAASILADKARIYEKIGKKGLAEQFYKSALEAFKKLDYSRYLSLLKKSRAAETLTQY
jgi:predicted GNAT family acetyltransferase